MIALAWRGWAGQLVTVESGDGLDPYGEAMAVAQQLRRHFARSAPAWAASRAQAGTLRRLALPALPLAMAALAVLMLLAWRARGTEAIALTAALVTTVVVNAGVCGMLSGVFDRYGSRVIWLLPFGALAAGLAWSDRIAGDRRVIRPDRAP